LAETQVTDVLPKGSTTVFNAKYQYGTKSGGNWPGDPDETALFDESSQMRVDYVRVFQMESYDTNVTQGEADEGVSG
jgi:hypothetical protein